MRTLGFVLLLAPIVVGTVTLLAEAWGYDRRIAVFVTAGIVSIAVGGILLALSY